MSDNSRRNRPPPRSNRNAPSDWSELDQNWLASQLDQDDFEEYETWHDTCEFEVRA